MQASMIDERACTSRSREPGVSRSTGASSRFEMCITSGCTSCCCIVLCLATFPYDFVDLQSSPLPASLTCTIEGSTVGTLCVAVCLLPACNVRHDQRGKEKSAPACRLIHILNRFRQHRWPSADHLQRQHAGGDNLGRRQRSGERYHEAHFPASRRCICHIAASEQAAAKPWRISCAAIQSARASLCSANGHRRRQCGCRSSQPGQHDSVC